MEKPGSPEPAPPSPGPAPTAGLPVAKMAAVEGDEAVAGVSSKLFQSACLRRWLPPVYREELQQVLKLTGPLLLSRILNFFLPFVTTIMCGHIGNAELAGFALASAVINVTTTATGHGLALACDTLISQTFGSKNMKRVGVILQRSSLILLLFCLPCWAVLINSYNLLLLMHQEEEVARIAYLYVMLFLPAVPAMFLHQLLVAYLQNQGIILPQMYTAAAANIFNLGINYILIFSLDLGVIGSAIANSLSQIVICLLLYSYIRWKKLHQQTWGGWSTDCLQEWGSYMKLAIPSAFMVCFEWWIWEVGSLLAGLLGELDLAALHILDEIGTITYMFPLGVHAAACVRVGNALGAGDTSRAKVTCKVALVLAGVLAVFQGIVIAGCKSVVGHIFTSDDKIVAIVSENLSVYPFQQFFDGLLCVCSGILVGAGMQKIAALSNLVCYYCIGLPVGIALMFAAELRILGFFLGLFTCILLELGFFLVLIFKLNWEKVTQKVGSSYLTVKYSNISLKKDWPSRTAKVVLKADGYSPVDTRDQELKAGHEANAACMEGDASNTKPQALLSVTQLILRRGLAFLVSFLILAVGVAFHIALPTPEPSGQTRANLTLNWPNVSTHATVSPLDLTTDL
uniref:Multidrug and toxin extrusion protein n=1 Tax=Scophthalmus maximus TaxID=52904 RepID=A0A8D3ABB7_SCOMX